jgi:hypothetical protein
MASYAKFDVKECRQEQETEDQAHVDVRLFPRSDQTLIPGEVEQNQSGHTAGTSQEVNSLQDFENRSSLFLLALNGHVRNGNDGESEDKGDPQRLTPVDPRPPSHGEEGPKEETGHRTDRG